MKDDFLAEFDALFADLARRSRPGRFEPNADVYLSDDGRVVVVDVEIAGADPTELRVMAEERRLHIIGRRIDRRRTGRGSVMLKEIAYGDFAKKLHLPFAVAHDEVTAAYRDGILTIALPISENALPVHRTEIRMTVRRTLV